MPASKYIEEALQKAPQREMLDSDREMLEQLSQGYLVSLPPFDCFSQAVSTAVNRSLDESGIFADNKEDRINFLARTFYHFTREVRGEKLATIKHIHQAMDGCRRCEKLEPPVVFSAGASDALILMVGEGPGAEEQKKRRPFVGKAGALLQKQVERAGIDKRWLYISNTVRCRPPGNRVPAPSEIENCFPWLLAEIEIISPHIIVTLGNVATSAFLGNKAGNMKDIHGHFFVLGTSVIMPTYHPSAALRGLAEAEKGLPEDLKKIAKFLDYMVKVKDR